MSLHQQIRDIVLQHGENIVAQRQFYNLLADYGAFKDTPAAKQIMNDLLHNGFGKFIYELKTDGKKDILQEIAKHKKEFLSDGKYRQDITDYIYASILFGLGVIENVDNVNFDNPYSTGPQQSQPNNTPIKPNKPALDLKKMLEDLKKEYLATFEEVVIPPKRLFGQASGYFEITTLNKQYVIENKIKLIIERIGGDADWCQNEKADFLSQYSHSKKKQQTRLGCFAATFIIVLIFVSAWTFNYITSQDAREQYEQTMNLAANNESAGKFVEAITLYKKAGDDYNANWKNGTYKNDAYEHAQLLSSRLFNEKKPAIEGALRNNDFITAKIEFDDLPSELVLAGTALDDYNRIDEQINNGLTAAINTEITKLANDIFKNNGKLSPQGLKRLEDMIKIAPDNYWLKTIKGKQK